VGHIIHKTDAFGAASLAFGSFAASECEADKPSNMDRSSSMDFPMVKGKGRES